MGSNPQQFTSSSTPPRRHNGLSRPYSKAQIAAFLCLVFSILQWLFFISPILPKCASGAVTLVFFGAVALVVHNGVLAVATDPLDVHLCQHWKETGEDAVTANGGPDTRFSRVYNKFNRELQSYPCPEEPMKHCWICDVQVAEHSMHCKFCNKCVYHFDHHCIWLNTCIGKANYRTFYRLLIWLCVMEFVHLAVQIYLIAGLFLDGPVKDRANDWIGSRIAFLVVWIAFVAFNCVSIILIGQLIQFHYGLQQKRLTTYEFIVKDHRQRRERARREGDLEAERVVLVGRAEAQGKLVKQWKLQCGGVCRRAGCAACDPLDLPPPEEEPDPEAGFARALGGGGSDIPTPATAQDVDISHSHSGGEMNGHGNNHHEPERDGSDHSESSDREQQQQSLEMRDSSSHSSSNDNDDDDKNNNVPVVASKVGGGEPTEVSEEGYGTAMEVVMTNDDQDGSSSNRVEVVETVQEKLLDDAWLTAAAAASQEQQQQQQQQQSPEADETDDAISPVESIEYDLNAVHQLSTTLNDDDDDDDDSNATNHEEDFQDEPEDDLSAKSGCSGRSGSHRSWKSGRSSRANGISASNGAAAGANRGGGDGSSTRSSKSSGSSSPGRRYRQANGERDYTAF